MKAERPENHTKIACGGVLGGSGGAPGSKRHHAISLCCLLDHFRPPRGGGPGPLWGALGVGSGALGASFGPPGGAFSRLGAGRGDNRTGSLKRQAFGIVLCWLIFGTVFRCFSYSVRCVAGAVFKTVFFVQSSGVVFCDAFPLALRRCSLRAERATTRWTP